MISFGIFKSTSIRFLKNRVILLILTIIATVVYGLIYHREFSRPSSSYKFSTTINYLKKYQSLKKSSSLVNSESNSNRDLKNLDKRKFPPSSCEQNLKHGCFEMASFWSGDYLKNFLFKGFNIHTKDGLTTLCVGLVGSAILYEGLRTLRDYLLNRFIDRRKRWRILQNRCSRLNDNSSPIAEIGSGAGPSRGRISASNCITSHYGSGDTADVSASLMATPEDEDDELTSSKNNVPKNSRRSTTDTGGDTDGNFSHKLNQTAKCHGFSLLVMSTLIHMIYITLGYIFMLSVMTFNVWLLVAVAIGVGIGQFLFGVFRRTDDCINEPSLLTGNTSSDIFNPSSSSNSGLNSQNRRHSMKLVHEEEVQEEGEVERGGGGGGGDVNIKNKNLTPLRTNDGNVQSDYYSDSSCYSRSSGSESQRSQQLTTAEISVHNVSTPDSYPKTAI